MKRYKKTYAIYHLTEKHTSFMLGKLRVSVSFTGGIVTKKGVTPATFTTEDPVVQLAIEQSADFRNGAVKIMAQYALEGEVKIGRNERPAKAGASNREAADAGASPSDKPAGEGDSPYDTPAGALPSSAEEAMQEQTGAAREVGLEIVEASCKDAAKAYLQDHFGEKPAPLRTREDVQNCAAKYGITFKFD